MPTSWKTNELEDTYWTSCHRVARAAGMQEEFDFNGTTAAGYLALPERGHGPGILVLHAWWGLTPFFEDVCERLAAEGFAAFAPDRYGGPTAATIEEAEALQREREDPVRTEAVLRASVEFLGAHEAVVGGRLGALGFSAGAAWALLLSVREPDLIGAVVTFYGTAGQFDYSGARAAYLGHYAEVDEWEPIDEVRGTREALREAGCEVTFHTYPGVGHWFFEEDRAGHYDARAAGLAWARTIEFLRSRVGQN
jgi:carboxymethylenebutenolidase